MRDFTLAIRAYNSQKYIDKLLDSLLAQTNVSHFTWEVVVIDNNSTDNTAVIIQNYQQNWLKESPLFYIFESRQGAAIARRRAFLEATGDWVAFLDDDNIPASNWLSEAYTFSLRYPHIGAYGGQIHGDFEVEPPHFLKSIFTYLAIIERGSQEFCYNFQKYGVLPPGAGIVVNREAWLKSVPTHLSVIGPSEKNLFDKGEDMEFLAYLRQANWEIWYNPAMHIYHQIPSWRLERDYLLSLAWGSGLNRVSLRMIRFLAWQKPFAFLAYLMLDSIKLIKYYLVYGSETKTNTAVAFQFTLLKSIVASSLPFLKSTLKP